MNGPEASCGELVDLRIDRPGRIRIGLVLIIIFFSVLILIPVLVILLSFGPPVQWIGLGVAALLALIVIHAIQRHLRRKHVRHLLSLVRQRDIRAAAEYISRHAFQPDDNPLIKEWVGRIRSAGQYGTTIRVRWSDEHGECQPLTFTFAPLNLDETEESFIQFEQGAAGESTTTAAEEDALRTTPTERAFAAKLRRNVQLKGVLMLCVAGYFFLDAASEAYRISQVTWRVCLWGLGLACYLYISPSSGWFWATENWLLVPSGLIHRKPAKDRTRSQLYLFDRRSSVLCAFQVRRASWMICVADHEKQEHFQATTREVNLLLRAWLSPLAPPAVEKLVDLT